MRVDLKNMQNAEERIRNFIKQNKRVPNELNMIDMDSKQVIKILLNDYRGMFYSMYQFWYKNGRFPNYVTKNITYGEPMILNFQDNKYNCCPTSLSMVSTKLFKPISEAKCAEVLGTNTSGTSPEKLINNGAKLGFKITKMARNPKNVQDALNRYAGVICHYETGDAPCSGFKNNYGHYCVIKSVKDGIYEIYDPTRGIYKCKTSVMDQATNGRALYYYAVELA